MHIYFSGIGGAGLYPSALLAAKLGHTVSGSDIADSPEKFKELRNLGATIHIGQDGSQIQSTHTDQSIDWYIYSSALPLHNPDHPELLFADKNHIRSSKINTFMNELTKAAGLKQLAIAGTHGKTTTTAMCVWVLSELGLDPGYMIGGKPVFGPAADIMPSSEWFVFENDEFDRRFLEFSPEVTVLSGVTYDHHDIYPTESDYQEAFRQYVSQAGVAYMSADDAMRLYGDTAPENVKIIAEVNGINLPGSVNRFDAGLIYGTILDLGLADESALIEILNRFPGVERRFEKLQDNLYTDYAHTPEKIRGALGVAKETSDQVVVIYEPLHNTRQHRIKSEYSDMFEGIKRLYWIPSYLAREDPDLEVLSPTDLIQSMDNSEIAEPAELNDDLRTVIQGHLDAGDLVLIISGGGPVSLDSWARKSFAG